MKICCTLHTELKMSTQSENEKNPINIKVFGDKINK